MKFSHLLPSLFRRTPRRTPARPGYRPALESMEDRTTPTTLPAGFHETVVTGGLVRPTAMAFAPDGRIFVAQQDGALRVIDHGALKRTPFLTLPVDSFSERGLLGVAVDPHYSVNHFIYVYYTTPSGGVHNRVSRFTANGDVAVRGSEVDLLDLEPLSAGNHNGGAIHFGPDGKLYVAVGENANGDNSQTLSNRLGKLLRINPDGSIPADNPFFNTATGVNRAIWALGLRNPFTFAFNHQTGRLFINDVGQSTWEEIDDGVAGANYGWPITEGPTSDPRFRGPLFAYGHGAGDTLGSAITGGTFYDAPHQQFPADYAGTYFFADLTNGWIRRLNPATGAVTGFATGGPVATVDLQVDSAGSLYYLSRGPGDDTGRLVRIRFTGTSRGQRFVSQVFLDLLNRPVDPGSLTSLAARVDRGGSPARIVRLVEQRSEFRSQIVTDIYETLLGQDPDAAALRSGTAFLRHGSVEDLMARLLGSTVYFQQRGGGTLAGFADALFQDVLGQPAGAPGVAQVIQLQTHRLSRTRIAERLLRSGTGRAQLADELFQRFLHQSPSAAEEASLTGLLGRPGGYQNALVRLLTSSSYLAQV